MSKNTDIQRNKYRHMLLSVHPDTARLVNTSALKTYTHTGRSSDAGPSGSRNACTLNTHMSAHKHACLIG